MNKIKIAVYVPLAAALAAGKSKYGETVVEFSDDDVLRMSDGAKQMLDTRYRNSDAVQVQTINLDGSPSGRGSVTVTAATVESTLEALENLATKHAQWVRHKKLNDEKQILDALVAPVEDWIRRRSGPCYYTLYNEVDTYSVTTSGVSHYEPSITEPLYLDREAHKDPRIVARRAEIERDELPRLKAEFEQHLAAWQATCAENERIVTERKIQQETIDAQWRNLCREYVLSRVPEFARAARDGKNVTGPAKKALRDEVCSWLGNLLAVDIYDSRDQETPRSFAYERMDATRSAIADRAGDHPLISAVEFKIVRGDISKTKRVWRTVVIVLITLANGNEMEDTIAVCGEESCADDAEDTDE